MILSSTNLHEFSLIKKRVVEIGEAEGQSTRMGTKRSIVDLEDYYFHFNFWEACYADRCGFSADRNR